MFNIRNQFFLIFLLAGLGFFIVALGVCFSAHDLHWRVYAAYSLILGVIMFLFAYLLYLTRPRRRR